MANVKSNQYWQTTQNYQSFEMRSHRFRNEMLPLFYNWLGISPDSLVLDGGCGSGVFTRYLAQGLDKGHINGFDISQTFIDYGRKKAEELGLSDKMTLEVADGYSLHYSDDTFDAVTNYTYIGVLADAEAGMKELIRVCKPNGTFSCVVATSTIPNAHICGEYPFDPDGEFQRLSDKENKVFTAMHVKNYKAQNDELYLFKKLGLKQIHMYPFSHLMCYNDTNFPYEYRKKLAISEAEEEINWLESRYYDNRDFYTASGFSHDDFERLLKFNQLKYEYLSEHFDTDESYEWRGGYNYIITGKKH